MKNPIEETLASADRSDIFLRRWPVDKPRAILVICHGLGEHGERYQSVADYLGDAGYAVFAHDHFGHGRSAGKRGHVERFSRYLDDTYLVVCRAGELYPDKKMFMMGHSLGGLIALSYALRHPDTLDGVIASGPALRVAVPVPAWKATLGRILSKIVPALSMSNELDPQEISSIPEEVKAYLADPLVHDRVSARFYVEFTAEMERVLLAAGALRMPLLAYHGGADKLTSPAGTKEFYERAASPDKTFRLFEGQRHEVHNDTAAADVRTMLKDWLDARV